MSPAVAFPKRERFPLTFGNRAVLVLVLVLVLPLFDRGPIDLSGVRPGSTRVSTQGGEGRCVAPRNGGTPCLLLPRPRESFAPALARSLWERIEAVREKLPHEEDYGRKLARTKLLKVVEKVGLDKDGTIDFDHKEALWLIVGLTVYESARLSLR